MGAAGSNDGLGVYRRDVEGVDGHEHVQDAGQVVGLLEVAAGAAGEPDY